MNGRRKLVQCHRFFLSGFLLPDFFYFTSTPAQSSQTRTLVCFCAKRAEQVSAPSKTFRFSALLAYFSAWHTNEVYRNNESNRTVGLHKGYAAAFLPSGANESSTYYLPFERKVRYTLAHSFVSLVIRFFGWSFFTAVFIRGIKIKDINNWHDILDIFWYWLGNHHYFCLLLRSLDVIEKIIFNH